MELHGCSRIFVALLDIAVIYLVFWNEFFIQVEPCGPVMSKTPVAQPCPNAAPNTRVL